MVTRTLVRVTSAEAAEYASNDRGKKHGHALPLPSVAGDSLSRDTNDENLEGNKRVLPPEYFVSDREITKRQKKADEGFIVDLTGVPPQPPIPKREGKMKEGASKYTGVTFDKARNRWRARITIDGKKRHIGYYENEEEAAIDYARAVFKYKGQEALEKAKEVREDSISYRETAMKRQMLDTFNLDLTDVPPQPPFPKSKGKMKEGASKYTGVTFDKARNRWLTRIMIDGKKRHIGYYENEEEAAIDYARAVFKYKGQEALEKAKEVREDSISYRETAMKRQMLDTFNLDLTDVPPQPPLPKSKGRMKEGASKYTGVSFNKATNKWQATIVLDGKQRRIGYYENEEEAAIDYARAAFKYKGMGSREIDGFNQSSSKYTGVYFDYLLNRWQARIMIIGEDRLIGSYENEQDALAGYARAFSKYKGLEALEKVKEVRENSMSYEEIVVKCQRLDTFILDLSDVPPQPPIPKSEEKMKEGASKYVGVVFDKARNRWKAKIKIDGTQRHIGHYEDEEEAAIDYARALVKYKGQGALDKARDRKSAGISIDLSDVQPQQTPHQPILIRRPKHLLL